MYVPLGDFDVPYIYSHARRQLPHVIQVTCGVSCYVSDVCRAPLAPLLLVLILIYLHA